MNLLVKKNQQPVKVTNAKDIESEAASLFSFEKDCHLEHLPYGVPNFKGDKVDGAKFWAELNQQDEYYVGREDKNLLHNHVIPGLKGNGCRALNFIDIAPGDVRALTEKSIPLLQRIEAANYHAIDLVDHFARNAAKSVNLLTNLNTSFEVKDVFEKEMLPFKNRSFIFMGGCTISNLPVSSQTKSVNLTLSSVLKYIRRPVEQGSYFLMSFDANQDLQVLDAAYGTESNAYMAESIMWQITRDTSFEYDASAFKYVGRWVPDEHRYIQAVRATRDVVVKKEGNNYCTISKGQILNLANSYKFPPDMMIRAGENAGWKTKKLWTETGRVHYILFEAI